MTCHPPVHLPREASRREGDLVAIPDRQDADPLFRQEEIDPDWRSWGAFPNSATASE